MGNLIMLNKFLYRIEIGSWVVVLFLTIYVSYQILIAIFIDQKTVGTDQLAPRLILVFMMCIIPMVLKQLRKMSNA